MAPVNIRLICRGLTIVNRWFTETSIMIKKPKTDEEAFELVLKTKTRAEIARHLGIAKQNLSRWKKVPTHHAKAVAALTGLPREYVLPSLFA